MKTVFKVEIEHDDPLPTKRDMGEVLEQRAYDWLLTQDVRVRDAKASRMDLVPVAGEVQA